MALTEHQINQAIKQSKANGRQQAMVDYAEFSFDQFAEAVEKAEARAEDVRASMRAAEQHKMLAGRLRADVKIELQRQKALAYHTEYADLGQQLMEEELFGGNDD